MQETDRTKPILVTGGSGYLASWIIKYLLDAGHTVRTTVRNKSKTDKVEHLIGLNEKAPGTLEFFEADLLKEGSFKAGMQNCEVVIHTASPFKVSGIKNPQKELIEPALEGTRNVLSTVNETPTVKRVVLTSSVVAVFGDFADIKKTSNGTFTEKDWNTTSNLDHQPYPYSKTLAEKEAWKMAEAQQRWDLVVINPGFIMGPSLTQRTDSTSIDFMLSLLNGKLKMGVPKFYSGLVDVRDVAKAHISAALRPQASGRHLLVADTVSFLKMANILRKRYNGKYPIPTRELPTFMLYAFGPFLGFSWKYLKRNAGIKAKFDNAYSKKDLGITYTPIDQTVADHAEQLIDDGLV